ncbi:MAG: phage terminase large subunit [Alphaproteobacteria bacterium]|nr:phage terminase large subunit [Alphaproteobacteria bacterium]
MTAENTASFARFLQGWNQCAGYEPPPPHMRRMALFLQEAWDSPAPRRALLQAFRSSGKSSLAAVFIAWVLRQNPDARVLVVGAEEQLAVKCARNVRRIIELYPECAALLPKKPGQWAADSFTVNRLAALRDPSLLAKGLNSNITGSHADLIVCDDVEVPNTCSTSMSRDQLRETLTELDYVISPPGMIIYMGTPHTSDTIYDTLGFLRGYQQLKLPVLDKSGQSVWPQRMPLRFLEDLKRRSGPLKFMSQMMLHPVSYAKSRLDRERVRYYDHPLQIKSVNGVLQYLIGGALMARVCMFWDPAFAEGQGDRSVAAVVFKDGDGNAWVHRLEYLAVDDDDRAAAQTKVLADVIADLALPAIVIETNGIGKFLPGIMRRTLIRGNIHARVIEHHSAANKAKRIIDAFDAFLGARALFVHQSVRDNTPFYDEITQFSPQYGGHDDGLDAIASALQHDGFPLVYRTATGHKGFKADTGFKV